MVNVLENCDATVARLYAECVQAAPNYGIAREDFQNALTRAARKYLFADPSYSPDALEIEQFLSNLHVHDLFLAIACANGNERAWWDFDQQHRGYLERVARHLAGSDVSAEEAVDSVYVELYGTRIVDGARQSKFATYTGRGSLRGWLRTVLWHSVVDLHRATRAEVSLDEMTETVGEGNAHAQFLQPAIGGESEMLDQIVRERYQKLALDALETAFAGLNDHEKLLLLFYHVEGLKLREIARLIELPESPLRNWFQRQPNLRKKVSDSRVHESTVMRWLEKTRAKILQSFKNELKSGANLKSVEIDLCVETAASYLVHSDNNEDLSSIIRSNSTLNETV